MAVKAGC